MAAAIDLKQRPQAHILVVEDQEGLSKTMGIVLRRLGYIPGFAFNGEEGVAQFKTRAYSLIFMDVNMPVMNGLEATRLIRAIEYPNNPVISIVGYTGCKDDLEAQCLEAGMNECLGKPASLEVIKQVIYKYLSKPSI
ncbi:MAG TPA: response regulator [Rhabdochlamydiaceae bacterium]